MTEAIEDDLPELFLRTARRIRRAQQADLAPLGLTPAQARALRILGHSAEPLRMSALADRLGIVPRSATTVVDALEAAGWVDRATDPANRRATLVALTDSGRAVLTRMSDARRRAARDLFARLSPAHRASLRAILAELDAADGDMPRG
ncbi:MarR family transcriptional regulator [Nocardia otitidiscaviarum]|uniref:MarR family winged helix-turn-helix transcriptional regulator n=1 Tax=Nocardia otitidiscaviarum TaxID=1823 RepID=UPI000693B17C|nr:MarR family transcriptional regulator [Nocardia otitidiscaviarum]MBF6136588.1 MarR family transcriptional regulator [Nocardia otitidiscaviarum]MBF6484790.1 MarR family transcriptional regulator [Nocardia otitidiscaviarum]